jgi:hypothetical protein
LAAGSNLERLKKTIPTRDGFFLTNTSRVTFESSVSGTVLAKYRAGLQERRRVAKITLAAPMCSLRYS